jgi:hypothetical protein
MSFSAVIVAANHPHAFEARGQYVAQIILDPGSRVGRTLQECYQDKGIDALNVGTLEALIAALATAYERHATDQDLVALADAVIEAIAGATNAPERLPDARIVR